MVGRTPASRSTFAEEAKNDKEMGRVDSNSDRSTHVGIFGRSVVLCITRITSTLWQINRIPSFDPTHLDHPLLHIQYLQWRICPLDRCSRTIQRPIAGVEQPIRRGKAIVLRFDDEFSQHTSRRSARNEASQHDPLGRHAAVWERDHHLQGRGSASLDDRATIHPLFHADRAISPEISVEAMKTQTSFIVY